jgi:small subunit ribosomal protein S16
MQRTGRRGHTQFRVVVQDSRFSPTSGRVVEYLGSYDPHAKTTTLDKDKAKKYLDNGAQPSPRAAKLLKTEGVKLPSWVSQESPKKKAIRNPEKLRRNRPAEPVTEEATEEPAAEAPAEAVEPVTSEEAAPDAEVSEPAAEPETPAEETPAEPEEPAS